MKINIPSKSDKESATLRDCLRLLAWESFKQDCKEAKEPLTGLELYEQKFAPEWKKHEIQKMNLDQLKECITNLGYTVAELLAYRSEHYSKRDAMTQTKTVEQEVSW